MVKAAVIVMSFVAAVVTAFCWSGPGAFAGEAFRLLRMQNHQVKWGEPSLGTGVKVTYAFVVAPREFPDAHNCGRMVPLDGLLANSRIAESALRQETAAAFLAWQKAANISFVETDDSASAQILIGAQEVPRWFAFTNVASHGGTNATIGTIDQALICLNPRKHWKIEFDGDLTVYDLRYTLIHEIGHAIGLDHAGASSQMMSFAYDEAFRDLQPGDITGIELLYGNRPAVISLAPEAVSDQAVRQPSPPATVRQ